MSDFIYTTAVRRIRAIKERKKIIQGGTSASKSYSILAVLIDRAIATKGTVISCVSESYPHLRRGIMKDFLSIMKQTNRFQDRHWNKTVGTYTFFNGSYIEFFSVDQESRLRGARRNVLFVNEANNINFESYHQLAIRTDGEIYIDFNPTAEFWAHKEVEPDEDAQLIVLTYKDNEALSPIIIDEIEKAEKKAETSSYWLNWWKVYGLGQIGALQGVVFSNYKIIDKMPKEAQLLGIGLDFGYTNDPTAITEIYKYNDKRILRQIKYAVGMVNQDIARVLPDNVLIVADSAEPKSIEEIRRHGKNIIGATKGKDSIMFGIDIMQQQEYLVTSDSLDLIKELRNYCWATDKTGAKLNKPIDNHNHAIDGIRYFEVDNLALKDKVFTF